VINLIRGDKNLASDQHLKTLVDELSTGLSSLEELRDQLVELMSVGPQPLVSLIVRLIYPGKIKDLQRGFDEVSLAAEHTGKLCDEFMKKIGERNKLLNKSNP
jgi:hypothetical protein